MQVATGLATARSPHPRLASEAVKQALERAGLSRAELVLLFLSSDFADNPRPALIAAASAAQTLSIFGCTALGIFSETDWLLDMPAAAAMVIGGLPGDGGKDAQLTLAAPNTLDASWLSTGYPRYGGIAGDITGLGPYKVWQQGQVQDNGRCSVRALGTPSQIIVSQGMRTISETLRVGRSEGFDLQQMADRSGAQMLRRAWRQANPLGSQQPTLHALELAAVTEEGIGQSWPVVSINPDDSVTIATRLQAGTNVVWRQRSPAQALAELGDGLAAAVSPRFGLMFSCSSRGAALFDGVDEEWALVRERCPNMPLLGFFGNGQIAPLAGSNRLLNHSVVLSLFS